MQTSEGKGSTMGMLEGRVAICTGAARGVGAEVAKMMATQGAKIVVVDPGVGGAGEGGDQRPAQVTVDEIKAAGGEAVANYGSVAEFDDCLAMVSQARDTFGGLHIVFNAAGILRDKMFHNMFPEDWQAVIDVHLTGHFNVNRAAINLFREQNYGRIIMVSSTSGLLGNIGQANYGTAKFGVVAMARIVAMENQSRGITANVICPSADTRMTRRSASFSPPSRRAKSTARYFISAPANCRSTVICGRSAWCTATAAGRRKRSPRLRSRRSPRNSRRSAMEGRCIRGCRWSEQTHKSAVGFPRPTLIQ